MVELLKAEAVGAGREGLDAVAVGLRLCRGAAPLDKGEALPGAAVVALDLEAGVVRLAEGLPPEEDVLAVHDRLERGQLHRQRLLLFEGDEVGAGGAVVPVLSP